MSLSVIIVPEAREQASEADHWWRINREKAPNLFQEELSGAVALLVEQPEAGLPYAGSTVAGTRRLVLLKTRFHLYYLYRPEKPDIVVLAVWNAVGVRKPGIPQPPP